MDNQFEYKGYKLGDIIELECPEDYYILIDDPETFQLYKYYVPKLSIIISSLYITLYDYCEVGITFLNIPKSRRSIDCVVNDKEVENMYGSITLEPIHQITTKLRFERFVSILNDYKKK